MAVPHGGPNAESQLLPGHRRDGTIYTGIAETLYALHPAGSIRWAYNLPGDVSGPAAVWPDGVVYVPTVGNLIALAPNGSLLWEWVPPVPEFNGVGGTPAVGSDGTIYVNTYEGVPHAVNPNGTTKWSSVDALAGGDVPPSPAIARDGTIYFGEVPTFLAINPDGTVKWRYDGATYATSPSVGGDGTIYFGATTYPSGGSVYALNPDGTLKWTYHDPAGYVRTPRAIGLGHRVYAGSLTGFFAIGP